MKIKNIEIKGKLILAPMAGYTNKVYRNICKQYGADLTVTEMVSDKGLLYENDKTWQLCEIDSHPTAIQLFGHNIDEMVKAAKILDKSSNCDIIDINMGCPVKKVLKAESGSYLLKDVNYIEELVSAIVKNVNKPVTVKIRTGWDHNSINCVEVAKAIERAKASAIAIHGRTKSDLYSGSIDYDAIKKVKEAVNIPVIGNGNVCDIPSLEKMLATGVDAVMIGRASLGNPWIFQKLNAHLNSLEFIEPTIQEKMDLLKYHLEQLIALKGEKIAILEMRSLACFYVKGMNNTKEFKLKLINCQTKEQFINLINTYFNL